MKLREVYDLIYQKLKEIDFESIWPKFHPFEFALYDDEKVYFKDDTIPKDERFIGNTAIFYNGEYIAIWYLEENDPIDIDELTSKICHEMFHAFQYEQKEKRFIREVFVTINYYYSSENLSLKHQENQLLESLLDNFEETKFLELLKIKKYRQVHFPFEFSYESKIEVVEGMAVFIEMLALKQINKIKYLKVLEKFKKSIVDIKTLLPIRLHCYNTGCLLILLCDQNNINIYHEIGEEVKDIATILMDQFQVESINDIHIKKEVDQFVNDYKESVRNLIKEKKKLSKVCNITKEKEILAGFEPYNGKFIDHYIYSPYFIAFGTDESNVIFEMGNFIVKIDDNLKVLELYKEE